MISIEDPNQGKRIDIIVPIKMTRKNIQLPDRAWRAVENMADDLGLSVAACIRMIVVKDLVQSEYLQRGEIEEK